ncbi:MAG: hypothetical protein IJ150_02425 [Bacteroidales bacterium]|nr:hypothetical protein [Bacteroidales bacterium]
MKKIALVAAFTLLTFLGYGQRNNFSKHVVFAGIGANLFSGDLGGGSDDATHGFGDLSPKAIRPSFSLGYEYRVYKNLSLRGGLLFSRVYGDDANSKNEYRRNRNLNFRSNIVSFLINMDYYFIPEKAINSRSDFGQRIAAYFTTGFGMFKFNPQGELDGTWYDLQPLCTEGQGSNVEYKQSINGTPYVYTTASEPYKLTAFEIPFGLGMNVQIDKTMSLGLEVAFHFTTTDYIDDCSTYYFNWEEHNLTPPSEMTNKLADKKINYKGIRTGEKRGGSGYNDAYSTIMLTLRYKLPL